MNLEYSFRKTRKWEGKAALGGEDVKIFLPLFAKNYLHHSVYYDAEPEDLQTGGADFIWALTWNIIHELCHNLGVRHNSKWTSYQGLL